MEIKNFGDLKGAILSGKEIEIYDRIVLKWHELYNDYNLLDFIDRQYRTKPEKEYVPFTADDWRLFNRVQVYDGDDCLGRIKSWDNVGVLLDDKFHYCYESLLEYNTKNNYPVGKEITK